MMRFPQITGNTFKFEKGKWEDEINLILVSNLQLFHQKPDLNSQLNDSLDSTSLNLTSLTFQAGNLTLRTLGLAGATVLSAELLGKVELEVENTLLQC